MPIALQGHQIPGEDTGAVLAISSSRSGRLKVLAPRN